MPSPSGGTGPESQGVNFVLGVQDFGSDVLAAADKVYQNLLNTMKQVAQWTEKFSANIVGKTAQAQAIDKANGGVSPIITPFTLTQKALDMMPKFIKSSYDWLRTSAAGMAQWALQIGVAGSRTRDFRDALAQAEIEGKKFKDQFAGVGSLLASTLGKAVGNTVGAGAGALFGAVLGGFYGWTEFYEKIHQVGIQMGLTTKQTTDLAHELLQLASSSNLSQDSIAEVAARLSSMNIPINKTTEDLVLLGAQMAKISQSKIGGGVSEDSIAAVMGNMVKVLGLSTQQITAAFTEAVAVTQHSSLNMADALNLIGPAANESFDILTQGLNAADRAAKISRVVPQLFAMAGALKDVGANSDVIGNFMEGMMNRNSEQFKHLSLILAQAGVNFEAISEQFKSGDVTGAFEAVIKGMQRVQGLPIEALTSISKDFNALGGRDQIFRIAQAGDGLARLGAIADRTGKSLADLKAENAAQLANVQNTPLQMMELIIQKIKLFWTEMGSQHNEAIIKGLQLVNVLLTKLFDFFLSHDNITAITFWAAALGGAISVVGGAFAAAKFLGWGDVFTVIAGTVRGLAAAMIGLRDAELAAAVAGTSLSAALAVPGVIAAGGLAVTAYAINDARKTQKANEEAISHGQSGHYDIATNQVVPDYQQNTTPGLESFPAGFNPDTGKIDVSTMEKHLADIKDMLKKSLDKVQLQPSKLTETVSGWPNNSPAF